jgi:hypothetical protein
MNIDENDILSELARLREQDSALRTLYRVPAGQDTVTGIHARLRSYIDERYSVDSTRAFEAVQECLRTQDPLLAFAAWYHTWVYGNMAFAQHYGVSETKLGMGLTVFRVPPFQVQLFLFRSGAVITPHVHPHVESYEVYVAGDMELTVDRLDGRGLLPTTIKEFVEPDEFGRTRCNGGMVRIPASSPHGGWIESKIVQTVAMDGKPLELTPGGAFLSIQYWKVGPPTSIQYRWAGLDGSEQG